MNKLQKGAKTAIEQCIRVKKTDKVLIITDQDTLEVGNALIEAANILAKQTRMLRIEDYTKRPAKKLPRRLVMDIEYFKPTVAIYAAQGKPGELPLFRKPLIEIFEDNPKCKYAHMIAITKELMEDGLNKDYDRVYKVTHKVKDIVEKAYKIKVTDKHGTNFTAEFDKKIRWVAGDGRIRYEEWTNLPSGETFTSPKTANGKFVGWILTDYFSEKYGPLKQPLTVYVKDGYITQIRTPKDASDKLEQIKEEFKEYVTENKNGDRVGEFGIGTLVGLEKLVGNALQDEKFPGVHIAFGHTYPKKTGQTWDAPTHVDVIGKDATIIVYGPEGRQIIMKDGKYIDEILKDDEDE